MKIQPRQQLLNVWRATAQASFRDGQWVTGGHEASNSISDAEQLLCIMYPVTELTSFQLATPDETAEDILNALHILGDSFDIPQRLTRALIEYTERYTDKSGSPIFSSKGYFDPGEPGAASIPALGELDIIDSFSMSITLTLATLAFIRNFRLTVRREELRHEMDRLEKLSKTRLTAAMVGLLRSFSVNVFDVQSESGRILCSRSNQSSVPERQVVADLRRALRPVRSSLLDLTIGSGQAIAELENTSKLFECGWSWGIVKDKDPIETRENFKQSDGLAEDRPLLYSTGVALDGIEDLVSGRVRLLGLLDAEQRELADALRTRWNLTRQYWSTIATFDTDRWPLEDLPWRTSDGQESDYYSLQVSSIVVQHLVDSRASDSELSRVGRILEDLANRGRITKRPVRDDAALSLHFPGIRVGLHGSEEAGGDPIGWFVSNFAPLLLKRTVTIVGLLGDTEQRGKLLTLADSVWEHLLQRRLKDGPGRDLWDQPGEAFDELSTDHELPSWSYTERVVECLVFVAKVIDQTPPRSRRLAEIATDLIYEAEHLFDRELLLGSEEAGPSMRGALQAARANLRRASEILNDRPGTAAALANVVLRELDRLAVARQDAARGT